MNKPQWIAVIVTLLLGSVMYFGFSIKKPDVVKNESTRALNQNSTSKSILLKRAKNELNSKQSDLIHVVQQSVDESSDDSTKIKNLKNLSGKWFEFGYPTIATVYAKEVAKTAKTAEAWSIAGSTAYIALRKAKNDLEKKYARATAIESYESAVSLAPDDISYKVNLAMTYVEAPPEGNPMKGVMMLLDMNKKHPDQPLILKSLAQLAIKTGQYEKAAGRLEKVVKLNPGDKKAWCLLSEAYKNMQVQKNQLQRAVNKCKE